MLNTQKGITMCENVEVAIVVPIYNVEKYVEKCIKSILNQSFKKIKIWAINDGSTDSSLDKIVQISK